MTDSRAAKRYARALFNAALKAGSLDAIDSDLKGLTALLSSSARFNEFIKSPANGNDEKITLLRNTLSGKADDLTMSLLTLLSSKSRLDEIFLIQVEFAALKREHEKVVFALIESAAELDEAQKTAIIGKVASVTGRTVEAEYRVDPSLLGGVKVTYDNYVLDGSARGHLNRLRENLLYDLLKQS